MVREWGKRLQICSGGLRLTKPCKLLRYPLLPTSNPQGLPLRALEGRRSLEEWRTGAAGPPCGVA